MNERELAADARQLRQLALLLILLSGALGSLLMLSSRLAGITAVFQLFLIAGACILVHLTRCDHPDDCRLHQAAWLAAVVSMGVLAASGLVLALA